MRFLTGGRWLLGTSSQAGRRGNWSTWLSPDPASSSLLLEEDIICIEKRMRRAVVRTVTATFPPSRGIISEVNI